MGIEQPGKSLLMVPAVDFGQDQLFKPSHGPLCGKRLRRQAPLQVVPSQQVLDFIGQPTPARNLRSFIDIEGAGAIVR